MSELQSLVVQASVVRQPESGEVDRGCGQESWEPGETVVHGGAASSQTPPHLLQQTPLPCWRGGPGPGWGDTAHLIRRLPCEGIWSDCYLSHCRFPEPQRPAPLRTSSCPPWRPGPPQCDAPGNRRPHEQRQGEKERLQEVLLQEIRVDWRLASSRRIQTLQVKQPPEAFSSEWGGDVIVSPTF